MISFGCNNIQCVQAPYMGLHTLAMMLKVLSDRKLNKTCSDVFQGLCHTCVPRVVNYFGSGRVNYHCYSMLLFTFSISAINSILSIEFSPMSRMVPNWDINCQIVTKYNKLDSSQLLTGSWWVTTYFTCYSIVWIVSPNRHNSCNLYHVFSILRVVSNAQR